MADIIYDSQEIIFKKGDPSEFAYVIKSGEVEILRDYPDNPFRIATLRDNNILGEMGLVDERPRSLTARAVSETRVAKISRDEFIDLLLNQPEEAFQYLRMFFERLRAMNMKVAHGDVGPPEVEKSIEIKDPVVNMIPETASFASVIGSEKLEISEFPFRIGRKSERNEDPMEVNDLAIPDSRPFNVSRNHFSIEKTGEGIFVHDRGSFLGTIVNGRVIGGHHKGAWMQLNSGVNEVIVGSNQSPFKFRVEVATR
ncbi:MAG: cyclic nucleotide-binding domain-containing protein [Pyrinomonadaceae bacterium]|nr:cyclic nucleotide-binding domain-containing protein [Pyrinomonadaceae bacterium]